MKLRKKENRKTIQENIKNRIVSFRMNLSFEMKNL